MSDLVPNCVSSRAGRHGRVLCWGILAVVVPVAMGHSLGAEIPSWLVWMWGQWAAATWSGGAAVG